MVIHLFCINTRKHKRRSFIKVGHISGSKYMRKLYLKQGKNKKAKGKK